MKLKLLLTAALVLLTAIPLSMTAQSQAPVANTSHVSISDRSAYTAEINKLRHDNGLQPLTLNTRLDNSAQAKANHIRDNNYWSHDYKDITPWTFINESGYHYKKAGENLAHCYDTVEETIQGWLDSPTHKANMLGDYKDIGIGESISNDCKVIVTHFGR